MNSPNKSATISVADFLFLPFFQTPLIPNSRYRLFSFWDTEEDTLVIATHGIVKKTQKTQLKEIAKAEEIRKEYFNNKKK